MGVREDLAQYKTQLVPWRQVNRKYLSWNKEWRIKEQNIKNIDKWETKQTVKCSWWKGENGLRAISEEVMVKYYSKIKD